MQKMYKIVNYETGEVAIGSALLENRSYLCAWYYRRALSWARSNVREGLMGIGGKHRPNRGVHMYALENDAVAWEVSLA